MSWLKKQFHKVKKSIHKDWHKIGKSASRLAHGKFHIGHQIRTTLPKSLRKSWNKLRWSKLVKGRLVGGNNSAGSITFAGDAPTNTYTYQGRTLRELM